MQISNDQIKIAAAAAAEVLSGADQQRTLALMEQLVIAKQLLAMVASGQLVIGQAASTPATDAPQPKQKKGGKRNGAVMPAADSAPT